MQTESKMDEALKIIADYTAHTVIESTEAYDTARANLADSLGCALLSYNIKPALNYWALLSLEQ